MMDSAYSCPLDREGECALFGQTGKCNLCDGEMYFEPKKVKVRPTLRKQKKSSRLGAKFEEENHESNKKLYTSKESCMQTPNSGAGSIKGDEWITSFITVMQELKTNVVPKISRGSQTYTCKRNELEKLKNEAGDANVEFYFLKFRFLESDSDTYTIINDEMIDAVLISMNEARKKVALADKTIDFYKARYEYIQAKNVELEAEIKMLKANLNLVTNKNN